jgi:tRNA U38,U39,U40 pseudouridine synthase TruA
MKKRKVAMFLAYVGHGYQGMQRNPGARTIEDELFKALHAAGAISDANADDNGFMKVLRGGGGWRRRRRVPPAAAVALLGTAGLVAAALPHAFSLHPHALRLPPCCHPGLQIHWMRAARTDKGVSAVGQVVSLKMVLEPEGMLQRINAALPDQVCVCVYAGREGGPVDAALAGRGPLPAAACDLSTCLPPASCCCHMHTI